MSKQNDVAERKAYSEPQLVEFGPLVELTRGGGNSPQTEVNLDMMCQDEPTWMLCPGATGG